MQGKFKIKQMADALTFVSDKGRGITAKSHDEMLINL